MAQRTRHAARRDGAGAGFGAVLVVIGIVFLAQQGFGLSLPSLAGPLAIVAVGLCFFAAMLVGGKNASGLAIPGSIITTIGLIITLQDRFGRFDTWTYAWALIVVAVGVGLLIQGFWTDDPKAFQSGLRVAGTGAVLFVVFGAFFELVVGLGGFAIASIGGLVWPILLIALGALLLLRRGPSKDLR